MQGRQNINSRIITEDHDHKSDLLVRLLEVNDSDMPVKVSTLTEVPVTETARVWFVSSMDSLVFCERREVGKSLWTLIAVVGFFSCMDSRVTHLSWSLRKSLATQFTLVSPRLLVEVTPMMDLQGILWTKHLWALWTLEWDRWYRARVCSSKAGQKLLKGYQWRFSYRKIHCPMLPVSSWRMSSWVSQGQLSKDVSSL